MKRFISSRSDRQRRRLLLLASAAVLVLPASAGAAAPHGGLAQLSPPNACLASSALAGCAGGAPINGNPTDITITRDGADVYMISQLSGLTQFHRDATTGALTPFGSVSLGGAHQAWGIAANAAGTRVYTASADPSAEGRVDWFMRGSDGALTAYRCAAFDTTGSDSGCSQRDGLAGARAVAVPPAGPGIYVASEYGGGDGADADSDGDGAVVVLGTASLPAAFTHVQCLPAHASAAVGNECNVNGAGTTEFAMEGVTDVVVTPDGTSVYAGGFTGLAGWARNQSTGALASEVACFRRLAGPGLCPVDSRTPLVTGLAVDPAGEHLYVAGRNRIAVYDRQPVSGALSFVQCLNANGSDGCTAMPGAFSGDGDIAVRADGAYVYTTAQLADEARAFRRDAATGMLTPVSCVGFAGTGGCTVGAGLSRAYGLVVSPDSNNAYVAAYDGTGTGGNGALAQFAFGHAPTCQGAGVDVAAGATVALPLACSDPDGEPLARAIASPAAGTLGPIDDQAGTVSYTAANAGGTETIAFTASDGANVSAPATVTVTVAAPPASPTPNGSEPARSRIDRFTGRMRARKLRRFSGKATGNVARVEIALVRVQRGATAKTSQCRRLLASGRLAKPTRRACVVHRFLAAKGTTRWTFRLKRRLPKGSYVVYSRAVGVDGAKETRFSAAVGNRIRFRLR